MKVLLPVVPARTFPQKNFRRGSLHSGQQLVTILLKVSGLLIGASGMCTDYPVIRRCVL